MSRRSLHAVGLPALALLPSLFYAVDAFAQAMEAPALPSVLVTATRYEQDPQVTPAFVTVITREQMESANVSTVNEAVTRIGGLATRTSLMGGNELTIDAMGFGDTAGSNLLILIDGLPLREGDASEIRLSGIPVESVERIEIQRSSGGVLYGGGSTGGVLNIITRAYAGNVKDGANASVYAGHGSYATDEYRVNARYGKDGFDMSLAASDRSSDGFRKHSANSDSGLFLTGKYTFSAVRVGMSLSTENNFAQTPGSLTLDEYRANRRAAQALSVAGNTHGNIDATRMAAFLESEQGGILWRFDASTRQRDYDVVAVKSGTTAAFGFSGDDQFFSLSGQHTVGTRFGQSRSVFGIEHGDWSQFRNYPAPLTFGNYQLDFSSDSFFVRNDLDLTAPAIRLTTGYRIERNERSQLGLSFGDRVDNQYTRSAWELGASKRVTDQDNVYARFASSFRFANIDEFGSSYYLDGSTRPLLPQTSKDLEAGWKHQFGSRGRMDVRIYRSDLVNELAFRNDLGTTTWNTQLESNVNLSPTRRQGADLDLSYQWTRQLMLASSLSLRDARFRAGEFYGKRVPMSAGEIVSLRAEYAPDERQKLGTMWRWTSSQYVTMDFDNQYKMPGYAVTDLYYQYRIGKFDLSLKMLNVFDKYYYSYATRATDSVTSLAYTAVYPDQGRSLWVSARLRF
jgi:iron complex outermembrane receptor protein